MGSTTPPRDRWPAWLLAAVTILAAYALALAWSGGFTFRLAGIPIRSHSWERPALLAGLGAIVLALTARDKVAAISARAWRVLESARFETALTVAAMTWTLGAGIGFGTFASGGSDSYGYVGQARLFLQGRLTDTVPLRAEYTWPNVEATLTPLGFTVGKPPGVIAPKYPPGLPLLFAPLAAFSERAIYLLVPVFGALLVWITFRLGAAFGDPLAGACAAVLLSASPTFLYQVVQPMSDVPAAACWLGALVLALRATSSSAACAGAITSLAILIRPNLAPLAALIAAAAIVSGDRPRTGRALAFAAALAPGLVLLGWIQNVRYGSPTGSGYGTVSDAFSWKYPLAGAFVRDRLPATAFVLAAQHSGSIRYYANRPTLRWDLLSPGRLDEAVAIFRAQGYEPFLVVDGGEYDQFKARFDATGQRAVQHLVPLAVLGDARVFAFR